MMTTQEQRIALAAWDGWSYLDKPLRVDRGFEGWGNALAAKEDSNAPS